MDISAHDKLRLLATLKMASARWTGDRMLFVSHSDGYAVLFTDKTRKVLNTFAAHLFRGGAVYSKVCGNRIARGALFDAIELRFNEFAGASI